MVVTLYNRMAELGSNLTGSIRSINADQQGQRFTDIAGRYKVLESYYDNEMYQTLNSVVSAARARNGLYRNIRPIRNPMRRAVDAYPGHIYPGAFTPDGLALPDGTPSCVPFAPDTDEALRLAISTALLWGNWGSERYAVCRQFALLGDLFGEVQVDYERGKVYPRFHHPSFVRDIEYNGSGDITMYRLEIPMFDDRTNKPYRWGKRVTKETITTYFDDQPHGYDGQDAESENQFGFCFAVWGQFRNVGGQHGASLLDGVRPKIDELNHILSSAHDYIGKFANQGAVFKTDKSMKDITAFAPGGATDDRSNPQGGRQEIRYLKGPADLTIDRLIQNLGLAESMPFVESLIHEIESDLPESTMEEKISQHPQVSGVALRMMFPGLERKIQEAQGNADAPIIKLGQMCVSIGGHLANTRQWGPTLTDAQRLFLPFDLASYDRGELAVTFLPRPLFPDTPMERVQTAAGFESLKTPTAMRMAGLDEDTITALIAEQRESAQQSQDALGRVFNSGGI